WTEDFFGEGRAKLITIDAGKRRRIGRLAPSPSEQGQ
ncbi:MAG: hypothetical protein ACJATT_005776, partial [Myxococcota bacterium]